MSQLKFRVWCKNKNEWESDEVFLSQYGAMFHRGRNGALIPLRSDTHDIEYTIGHSDKHSIEIHQGDVLAWTTANPFCDNGIEHHITVVGKEIGIMSLLVLDEPTLEIIGNVHENPDILSQAEEQK